MRAVIVSLLLTLRASLGDRAALQLEILALRHQLQVVNRSRRQRLRLTQGDRMLWVWLSKAPLLCLSVGANNGLTLSRLSRPEHVGPDPDEPSATMSNLELPSSPPDRTFPTGAAQSERANGVFGRDSRAIAHLK